ncbi:carotenoid oxygenase [Tuber brumale]|nr:carotenoid oxygenase [Tuber brumale]
MNTSTNTPGATAATKPIQVGTEGESFGNWPNSEGFDVFHDERTPIELRVTGSIPEYALGVLYRTGPGGYQTETTSGTTLSMSHWFDAFGQVHRFNIVSPMKVLYNSRHTCDGLLLHMRETGQLLSGFSFGQRRDPCQSFFKKFVSLFEPRVDLVAGGAKNASKVNVSVTVSTNYPGLPDAPNATGAVKNLYTKTDATTLQALDPETLEPIGIANQVSLHPELKGPCSAAHARSDPLTGNMFNYNLTLGKHPRYKIFQVSKATGKTTILATITDAPGAYIHSFFLTPRYVVLCVWGAYYAMGGLKMLYYKNVIDAIDAWDPNKQTKWYVIDRTDARRGVVSSHPCPPFFAFHSVNAWEEGDTVVAEVPAYDNLDIIKKFYLENLKGDSKAAWTWAEKGRPRLTRWRMDTTVGGSEAEVVFELDKDSSMELPTMNPGFVTLPHRFTYGLLNRVKSTLLDGIVKFDSITRTSLVWEVHGHTPGECIFVPDPQGTEEDDGVLLSVVLDGFAKKSYLLVLLAKDLVEVARAELDTAVSFGFHGRHVNNGGRSVEW